MVETVSTRLNAFPDLDYKKIKAVEKVEVTVRFKLGSERFKQVELYKYPGTQISDEAMCKKELKTRLTMLRTLWRKVL